MRPLNFMRKRLLGEVLELVDVVVIPGGTKRMARRMEQEGMFSDEEGMREFYGMARKWDRAKLYCAGGLLVVAGVSYFEVMFLR